LEAAMSALLLEAPPAAAGVRAGGITKHGLLAVAALAAGALAPWLLLVGAHGGLARSAAACLAGPLPI
jgi:hypothetical protein